ncbi:alpha/beta fold hydrolase [Pararhodobacter zhoushanensis]|uniref:Alpha/beta hydrolase n=1 Tax=Pararhodobacter zhoushanensis TaxID=2479545 RepID=A0ABT3GTV4_9RHOB|nr:alpha/beta hydrolase [Pararhodobacter zhoushanensis]MCW1930966.1 alpha/beta hydrolase [Pararhodobacter zhoushanensis]
MTPATALHRWGAGAPVILLHGWTMTGDVWAPVAERLKGESFAPDLPGHGATTGYAPSVEGGVAQLRDLIADQGLQEATLVGWSLGALIGWSYLAQGGTGIARMVSLDMSPCPLPAPGWDFPMRGQNAGKAARGATRFRRDWPAAAPAIAQGMFARPEGCALMSRAHAETRIRAQNPDAMTRFWTSLTMIDLRLSLTAIRQPLLALHGAQSRVYPPATGHWIAQHAPSGRALVLPGCGHAPNLEDPAATATAIARFQSAA